MAKGGIGSIQIDVDAMIARFDTNMDKANKRLDGVEKAAKKAADAAKKAADKSEAGWKKAGAAIKLMTGALVAAGTAVVASRFVRSLDAAADKVVDLGKKAHALGIPVEKLSELRFAAEESNVSFEELTKLLSTASRNLGEFANNGGGPAARTVAELNLELFDASGNMRDIVDLLPELSRKLGGLDKGQQLSAAGKLFGEEGGARFVQMLEDSSNFLDTLAIQQQRAGRLGVVFTEEQVQRLTAYADAVHRVGEAWFGIKVRIIDAVAPEIEEFLNDVAGLMAATPSIVESIAEAFRSDDPEIRRQLDVLGDSMLAVFEVAGSSAGIIFTSAMQDALTVGAELVFPTAMAMGWRMTKGVYEGIADALAEVNDGSWPGFIATQLMAAENTFRMQAMGAGVKSARNPEKFMQSFTAGLSDDALMVTPRALELSADMAASAWNDAFGSADALFGIMQKIRGHSMDLFASDTLGPPYPPLQFGGVGRSPKPTEDSDFDRFLEGANKGYTELLKKAEDFEALGTASITSFADTISGDLASALASGEMSLENFGETATEVFTKAAESVFQLILRFYLAQAVLGGLSLLPGIGGTAGPDPNAYGPFQQRRGGAWLDGMPLRQYAAGGIVNRPTVFPMRRGMGLMGEAGPEAIMPLTRVGGKLGVHASTGGVPVMVQVIDQRGSGEPVSVQEDRGPDGRRLVRILIRDEVRQLLGGGALDKTMGATFGVRRQGTPR